MILLVRILGVEVLHLEVDTQPDPADIERGPIESTVVGFVARSEIPGDVEFPER